MAVNYTAIYGYLMLFLGTPPTLDEATSEATTVLIAKLPPLVDVTKLVALDAPRHGGRGGNWQTVPSGYLTILT